MGNSFFGLFPDSTPADKYKERLLDHDHSSVSFDKKETKAITDIAALRTKILDQHQKAIAKEKAIAVLKSEFETLEALHKECKGTSEAEKAPAKKYFNKITQSAEFKSLHQRARMSLEERHKALMIYPADDPHLVFVSTDPETHAMKSRRPRKDALLLLRMALIEEFGVACHTAKETVAFWQTEWEKVAPEAPQPKAFR